MQPYLTTFYSLLSIEMLGALLALYLKDDMNAIKYLALYLKGKNKKKSSYFYTCLDYLRQ